MFFNFSFVLAFVQLLNLGKFNFPASRSVCLAQFICSAGKQSVLKEDETSRPEKMGLLAKFREVLEPEVPIMDLKISLFAIAEIAMDGANAEILAKNSKLWFFKKDALAKQMLDEIDPFVKGLPRISKPWQLVMIEVYVKEASIPAAAGSRKTIRIIYPIAKGEWIERFKERKQNGLKVGPESSSSSDHEGVLISLVEERSDRSDNLRGKKGADATRAPASTRNVSATIWLTFSGFEKGEFQKRTRVLQVKHKKDLEWELLGK